MTPHEVDQVIAAARKVGRHSSRDVTLILLMYRHGLRVTEAVSLRWDAVNLRAGLLHVHRIKNGQPAVHPLRGPELEVFCPTPQKGIVQGLGRAVLGDWGLR